MTSRWRRQPPPPVPDTRRRVLGCGAVGRGILIPFVIALVALGVMSPPFLRPQNLANILDQQSGIIIVAAAGTLVLIAGGIDLSVGAVYGLAAAVSTQLVASVGRPARRSLAGLGLGLLAGIANGVLVDQVPHQRAHRHAGHDVRGHRHRRHS